MATFVKVRTSLLQGDTWRRLRGDFHTQSVFYWLILQTNANPSGILYAPLAHIAADIGSDIEATSRSLRRLIEASFLVADEGSDWVWIVNSAREQLGARLDSNPQRFAGLVSSLRELPASIKARFLRPFLDAYNLDESLVCHIDAASMPHRGHIEVTSAKKKKKEKEKKKEKIPSSAPASRRSAQTTQPPSKRSANPQPAPVELEELGIDEDELEIPPVCLPTSKAPLSDSGSPGWVGLFGEEWRREMGGDRRICGRIGARLKPLIDEAGVDEVYAVWSWTLRSRHAPYTSPETFAAKWRSYQREMRDSGLSGSGGSRLTAAEKTYAAMERFLDEDTEPILPILAPGSGAES